MKFTTTGKSCRHDWYGLFFLTKVPTSWTVTVETLGWEAWKITIRTSNGFIDSVVLKKTGDKPSVLIEKRLFHKNQWDLWTKDTSVEDGFEEKQK